MTAPSDPMPLEETITVVGVGLIGGSIAAAAKKRRLVQRVIGVGRDIRRLQAARERGLIDESTTELSRAAAESGLMIFCTPVDHIADGVREAARFARPGTLITDAGSTKRAICEKLITQLRDGVAFVGSHPLAGSEKQGFEFADADLFEGRVCVLTPVASTPDDQLARLRRFWEGLGLRVLCMSPAEHDRALAKTSHVPHVVASALSITLADQLRSFAATGFRDTTRIAAGDPDLWTAILLTNADEVLEGLDSVSQELTAFRHAIEARDAAVLKKLLQAAKRNRDSLA